VHGKRGYSANKLYERLLYVRGRADLWRHLQEGRPNRDVHRWRRRQAGVREEGDDELHDWRRERRAEWVRVSNTGGLSGRDELLVQLVLPMRCRVAYLVGTFLTAGCYGSPFDATVAISTESMMAPRQSDSANEQVSDALLQALFAYDLSVRSLVWEQAKYQPQRMATWVLAETRRVGVDHSGQWFSQSEFPTSSDAEEENGIMRGYRYFDGEDRMFGYDLTVRRGKVVPPDRDLLTNFSPFHLLGQYVDFSQGRTLPELLASSPKLHILEPESDQPWPGLRGDVNLLDVTFTLSVRIDPSHGYAPRSILLVRKDLGAPLELLETTRYKQVDRVWIPTAGVRGLWTLLSKRVHPDGHARAEGWAGHAKNLEQLNGIGGLSASNRAAMWHAVQRTTITGSCTGNTDLFFYPMGGSSQTGPFTPEILVATIISCNDIATDWLQTPVKQWSEIPAPPSAWMFDLFRGRQSDLRTALEPITFADADGSDEETP